MLERLVAATSMVLCLVACSQNSTGPVGSLPAVRLADLKPDSSGYQVLFSFGVNPQGYDGAMPAAGLALRSCCTQKHKLGPSYGTTLQGGTSNNGTVFSFARSAKNKEQVVYNFGSGTSGEGPLDLVAGGADEFYGTTVGGGTYGAGTIFSVNVGTGSGTTVHSFGATSDGAEPKAGMIYYPQAFFGTTSAGGTYGEGTVFALHGSGEEQTLYSFGAGADGAYPVARLAYGTIKNTFYGTTESGGAYSDGTIFSITTTGVETVLFSFSGANGRSPEAGLSDIDGVLYGTTYAGGSSDSGTVFAANENGSGSVRVLHSFASDGVDGVNPEASLIERRGRLYGTTSAGGGAGEGTVFDVDAKSGKERILHAFGVGVENDGADPSAHLNYLGGKLYGTTQLGGYAAPSCYISGGCHLGTVFSLKP
jgi:uncharacterized repeat protein (TIGR03803 family)